MIFQHKFIFQPGEWIGQGKLLLSFSPEPVRFLTRWVIDIQNQETQEITCKQVVERGGGIELIINHYRISKITSFSFDLELTNESVGSVTGKGIIDADTISWEFEKKIPYDGSDGFKGFEIYTLQPNGDYHVHAEYSSGKQFQTKVEGRIWMHLAE